MVVNHNCHNTVPRAKVVQANAAMLELFVAADVLEETAEGQIHFRFERFYDYYFGCYLREVIKQDVRLDCRPTAGNS